MYKILEALKQNPGSIFTIDRGEVKPFSGVYWKTVYRLTEAVELVAQGYLLNSPVGVEYQDGAFHLYNPTNMVYALFLGDTVLIKHGVKGKLPQVQMGQTVCSVMSNYMDRYEQQDNFLTRARMLTSLGRFKDEEVGKIRGVKEMVFDPNKVTEFKSWTNHFHKPSVVLYYNGLPPIFGLSKIKEIFPDITDRDLRRLYQRYSIPLPYKLR